MMLHFRRIRLHTGRIILAREYPSAWGWGWETVKTLGWA
jgi:hypothetical protein